VRGEKAHEREKEREKERERETEREREREREKVFILQPPFAPTNAADVSGTIQ
jgi:hypothetical protein